MIMGQAVVTANTMDSVYEEGEVKFSPKFDRQMFGTNGDLLEDVPTDLNLLFAKKQDPDIDLESEQGAMISKNKIIRYSYYNE